MICRKCKADKPVSEITKNTWCRKCMREYLKEYKAPRLSYSDTLLTDSEMKEEMRSIKKFDTKGLNALIEFTEQFDRVCKEIKSFNRYEKPKEVFGNPKAQLFYFTYYS